MQSEVEPSRAAVQPPIKQEMSGVRPDLLGDVVNANGAPVVGATVYVYTAKPRTGTSPFCPSCYVDCGKRQVSDARGRFRIASLDPTLLFRLLVVKTGYDPVFVPNVDPLQTGTHITVNGRARPAAAAGRLVSGQVLDPAGQPVVGATVEATGLKTRKFTTYGTIPNVTPVAVSDERGLFQFEIPQPNAALAVLIKARGLAPKAFLWLDAGAAKPNRCRLADGATFVGFVRDSKGNGLPGVTVQAVPTDRGERFPGWFEIGTDAHGRYDLPNLPADQDYRVCVRMDSIAGSGATVPVRMVRAGKDDAITDGVDLTACTGATIAGRVVLSDGKPIPAGTRLMLDREATWDTAFISLGPDGRFAFHGVPPGEKMELVIQVRGYRLNSNLPGAKPEIGLIPVTAPQPPEQGDLVLSMNRTP